jgi:3-oxoacyl-[acyl-carrier protein] reductase
VSSAPRSRVALVTGGGNGLGAVIVRALHAAGYCVAAADCDAASVRDLAAALDPSGTTITAVALDVRDKAAFERALAELQQRWGGADVLVNNAAVTLATPVMAISPAEFDDVMAVNLRGTFFGCQVFGEYFRGNRHGRIVNIASLAGQNGGTATGAHYAASKGAIMTLTKVFARELGGDGVTVNAIAPGPLDLPLTHRLVAPERLAALRQVIPTGELGDAHFVARLVVELAAPDAGFANGATWDVNGGLSMR